MRNIALIAIFYLLTLAAAAQTTAVTQEMRQEANRYYQAGEWAKAAAAYQKIIAIEDGNPNARYRLGTSLLNLNRNAEALAHLERAFKATPNPSFALALTRAYARVGNKDKMLSTLEMSLMMGGIPADQLTTEKDFGPWLNDPAFKDIVRRSDLAAHPCKASQEFRQFDFWIGEWEVHGPQGAAAGTSSVQLMLDQCVIQENWTGTGNEGKSFNLYDRSDGKWHQTWVSDKGVFTHYVGGLVNGEMVLTADTTQNGKRVLQRMTFTKLPGGEVRQHGQSSNDDGKTWTTTFDLTYVRKK